VDNVEIQIVSFHKDLGWCEYALRSIQKFATGFAGVTLVVPDGEVRLFAPFQKRFGVKLFPYKVRPGKAMLHHMVMKCRADETCLNADHILHMDSDCVFIEPVTPDDYFVLGKPVLLREKFSEIAKYCPARCKWQAIVEKTLGFKPEYEMMVRHPAVHFKWLYRLFRDLVWGRHHKPFDEYVLGCSEVPLGFTEFPALGAVALKYHEIAYHWVDAKSPHTDFDLCKAVGVKEKMRQFWSHAGVEKHKEELEKILG